MQDVTALESSDRQRVRELVQERIDDVLWTVDVHRGLLYGKAGRLLRGARTSAGYVQFNVLDPISRKRLSILAHRVIWESAHGPITNGLHVNHMNGIKTDNRIANLELVTLVQNVRHAHLTGLMRALRGSEVPSAQLHERDVPQIRALLDAGHSYRQCAEQFGVSKSVIAGISTGKTWRHVA